MSCDSISSMEHKGDMPFGHQRLLWLGDKEYSESDPPATPHPNTFTFEPSPGNASMPDADTAFLVLAPPAQNRRRHSDRPGLVDWAYPRSSTPLPSNQSSSSTNTNSFDLSLTLNSDSSILNDLASSSSLTFPSPQTFSTTPGYPLQIPGRKHRRSGGGEVVGLGLFGDDDGSILDDVNMNAGMGMGVFDFEQQPSGISKTFRDEIAFTFTQDFSGGDSVDDVFTTAYLDDSVFNDADA